MVDDRAPLAAKPPTAVMFFPLRRIGRGGNSAARARLKIAVISGERRANEPPLDRRSAAEKWRRRGGPPPINPDSAINSLLTRFTQRHRTGARIKRPRLQTKAE
jgi:hypothetical protein